MLWWRAKPKPRLLHGAAALTRSRPKGVDVSSAGLAPFPARHSPAASQGIGAAPTTIDLWGIDLAALETRQDVRFTECLQPDEHAQANRYLRVATGQQFRLTRGALRRILAIYLNCAPAQVPLCRKPMGKPALAPPCSRPALTFNVSHTDSYALVALCNGREIGVDVETRNRSLDVLGMAERFFAPEETAELRTVGEAEQLTAFLQLWTRKEALLKGQGRGLSQDWTDVRVGSLKCSPVTIPSADLAVLWQVLDLDLQTKHMGAVAIAGTEPFHVRWRATEELF